MSEPQSSSPVPRTAHAGRGIVGFITILILVCPLAALAAGAVAFIGMSVAVVGWGEDFLGSGAAVGAGVGVLLVGVWAVVFISRARASKEDSLVHAEKLAAYFQDMQRRGTDASDGPVFRLLWMLGLKIPPPSFFGTWGSFLYPFGVFAPMVLTAGAILWWQRPNSAPWIMWLTASIFLLVAIGLGVYNVKATRSMALKLQLPSWDQYTPAPLTVAEPGKEGKTS